MFQLLPSIRSQDATHVKKTEVPDNYFHDNMIGSFLSFSNLKRRKPRSQESGADSTGKSKTLGFNVK